VNSNVHIFADTAPSYWAVGLPAIPLRPAEKIPAINAWQRYGSELEIDAATQASWLGLYGKGNIGLALGVTADICMIDIDTDSDVVRRVLSRILPPSPWERRGRKGCMLAYRYSGFKTFRIKDRSGAMLVEGLSTGTQCVLPPSIHPDTKRPYEADVDLFDPAVLAQLLHLPPDIEGILRAALDAEGIELSLSGSTKVSDYVASGARDVTMIGVAGVNAQGILRGEQSFSEAVQKMVAWHGSLVEKVAGDDIDIEKGIQRLAEFLIRDVTKSAKKRALPIGWDAGLTPAERTGFGFDVFTDENVGWDFDKLKEYLKIEFTVHDAGSIGRRHAVRFILDRLAHSQLTRLDEDAIIEYIVHASQCGYSKSGVRATLTDIREGGISGINQTEVARAVLEQLDRNGSVAYVGGFWQWSGSHYRPMKDSDILLVIAQEFGHLAATKKANDHAGVMKIMSTLVSRNSLRDTSVMGVNFANGYLTTDLELLPHHPDYGCTYTLPYRYLPELVGRAPRFEEFLQNSWGHDLDFEDKRMALQEAIAVTMFGMAPRIERAICLHGVPGTGKSQMLRLVEALMPDTVRCTIPPENWGDRFLPAQLHSKLINVCGELSEDKKINGAKFKQIISGEVMTGQHKNKDPFAFNPVCAHWFASNHLPRTEDTSQGFNRRWLLLTYTRRLAEGTKVLDIGLSIVAEEREAIVSWAVQAITQVLARGDFTLPHSHLMLIEEVAKANNSLRSFLLDSNKVFVVADGSGSTPVSEIALYNTYFSSALAAGVARPVLLPGFRQKMRELGSVLGFNVLVRTLPNGGQECTYENITLAKPKQAPVLTVVGTP
jgi:putative DNA primase/helicase